MPADPPRRDHHRPAARPDSAGAAPPPARRGLAAFARTPLLPALLLPMLLVLMARCADEAPRPPAVFAPMAFDYLTKIRLNVATIDINDTWVPSQTDTGDAVSSLAPTPPRDALRTMAQDRLVAAGGTGRAVFTIDDASIVRDRAGYAGSFAVHLDVLTSDGAHAGFAEARVTRRRTAAPGDADSLSATRAALDDMTRQMMADMNVEFEFQIRHALRDYVLGAGEAAPPAGPTGGTGPVERQDLTPPGGGPPPSGPTPAAPTPAPPIPAAAAPGSDGPVPPEGPLATPLDSLSPPPGTNAASPADVPPPAATPAPAAPAPAAPALAAPAPGGSAPTPLSP